MYCTHASSSSPISLTHTLSPLPWNPCLHTYLLPAILASFHFPSPSIHPPPSSQLLGELLLDRHNFTTMTRYISNTENLKLMMTMLRDRSRNIQFEAFHVFKVFVANPNKTKSVQDILLKNKDKLVEFLSKFHNDRTGESEIYFCLIPSFPDVEGGLGTRLGSFPDVEGGLGMRLG